ncbi:MAG: ATP-binding cassette domain-containing protein [Pseudomonadota bacterium]|nr:ATP-binding cassette domain-containing protein [Pseudomonadota bacterium]
MDAKGDSGVLGRDRPAGPLVRLVGVRKVYGHGLAGVHALNDIHLQLAAGEMVAVCGPSGHGKTSLLNLLALLETATEGQVEIAGLPTSTLADSSRAALRAELIGHVGQATTLIPVMTALENVLLPLTLRLSLHGAMLAEARALAAELLARVGLKTQTHHYPARLDPGQRQRVAIARALVTQPRLVVADEATSRLDHGGIRLVMDLFAAHQHEFGTAFVLSTRDQRQLSRVTRTLQLNEGRLAGAAAADAPRRTLRVQR